jgi:putative IMPACT (imprinted ancient) family translation regulator
MKAQAANNEVYTLTVKKSRFYAVVLSVNSEQQIKVALGLRKKAVKKACHHCWAARFTAENGQLVELAKNDGEVGKPGHKMLEILRQRNLECAVIVSRIFGGVKLGPAGVGRAFMQAALGALEPMRHRNDKQD